MPTEPETRYAPSAGASIAYQVAGEGPVDIAIVPGWLSHVDLLWRDPGWVRFIEALASFSRVILYDPRGSGLSDPADRLPTLENRADDLRAVLDAADSERATLFGLSMGGPLSVMFGASYPERTSGLVLYGTYATGSIEDDGTPEPRRWIELMAEVRDSIDHWGEGRTALWAAPSLARNIVFRRAVGAFERASMSPTMARLTWESNLAECDVSAILESVLVPTLVLHRRDERIPVEYARDLAARIPGARLVELEGEDHFPAVGDVDAITGEVEEFITGARHQPEPDRVLATVLFTDIVDSTKRAAEVGDRAWRGLLEEHDEIVRAGIGRFRGHEVKHTGDGFLATFDGPARGVRCAVELSERLRERDIEIRCGVHTGECELRGDDIGGIAVHIGARIGALAGPGEVLVSSTVKDLVAGSGIAFEDRGSHALKGVPDTWRLFSPAGEDRRIERLPALSEPKRDPVADRIAGMPRLGRALMRLPRRG
jgi:class 3 adenylate cyclase